MELMMWGAIFNYAFFVVSGYLADATFSPLSHSFALTMHPLYPVAFLLPSLLSPCLRRLLESVLAAKFEPHEETSLLSHSDRAQPGM